LCPWPQGLRPFCENANCPYPIPYTPTAPHYYSLKGTFLGTAKPTAPGVYIEATGVKARKIMVR
ncbi:MAG: hypothetical protein FWC26_08710, partial [Fibromonadales bacterium]|nr:hypothetical protein [Fibromonadales bacterium]